MQKCACSNYFNEGFDEVCFRVNYNYLFYYGTYYLQVPKIYSIALLNKGQETSIQYKGDINKTSTSSIYGTTNDGIYNFYF